MIPDDLSLQEWPNPKSPLGSDFEKAWRELDAREKRKLNSAFAYRNVQLDCNGELVDIGSIALLGLRESRDGVELIEFVCPRCDARHESPRFG